MRLTLRNIPNLMLAFLPMITAYNGYGTLITLLCMILWLITQIMIICYLLLFSKPKDDRVILNTLPISHHVEKVRWCMDKSGMVYEEEKDIGIFWIIMTGRLVPTLKIPKYNISIANSSDILKYLYANLLIQDEEKAKFMKPSAKSREMEIKIEKMGNNLRVYLYYHILVENSNFEALALKTWGIHEENIPVWQKIILKVTLPLLRQFIIKVLKVNKENANSELEKANQFFEETDKILSQNKFLLGTEDPTYIDLAFASLASLLALPDQYGGSKLSPNSRLRLTDFSHELQDIMKQFRSTISGKFVNKMYVEYR